MSDFSFLNHFVVPNYDSKNNLDHLLFKIKQGTLEQVESELGFTLPLELRELYVQVGFGFFWQNDNSSFDRLLSPLQVKQITLKEDFYEYDPDLELYDDIYKGEKLLFFEVNEGVYLGIDKTDIKGKNAIYYFKNKIADSLEEFLKQFLDNPNLIKDLE
ncbi:MAG: SMI1/KNR4 family protein [Moheibacter sp.]